MDTPGILERVRRVLERVCLSHTHVGIVLTNDINGGTHDVSYRMLSRTGASILRTAPATDARATFTQLFGPKRAKDLRSVSASTSDGTVRVRGYLAVESHHSNHLQVSTILPMHAY